MAAGAGNSNSNGGMRMKAGGGAVAISKQGGSQMNSTKLGNNKRNKIAQICQKATVHQVSRFAEFTYSRVDEEEAPFTPRESSDFGAECLLLCYCFRCDCPCIHSRQPFLINYSLYSTPPTYNPTANTVPVFLVFVNFWPRMDLSIESHLADPVQCLESLK